MMSKEKWYSSSQHFKTEKSYDEYKKDFKIKTCPKEKNIGWFAKNWNKIMKK